MQANTAPYILLWAGPMRRGIFAVVLFAQWLYVASLLPGAPPNFVEAAGKFGMFSGNMR